VCVIVVRLKERVCLLREWEHDDTLLPVEQREKQGDRGPPFGVAYGRGRIRTHALPGPGRRGTVNRTGGNRGRGNWRVLPRTQQRARTVR